VTGWHYAVLERLHGHVGWLALALLLHPVLTLRLRRGWGRWTQLTADLAVALLAAPYVIGLIIYPGYRAWVKPDLLREAPAIAAAFETQEHLAAFALALAVGGALTLRAGRRSPAAREAAWSLLAAAWLCGVATGAIGFWVSGWAHPGF
jgi:hypothetical protein